MTGRVVAVAYVATVAGLTARAFSDANQDHWGAEIAAAVLALPLIIPALPFIYVLGGLAWNFADTGSASGSASGSSSSVSTELDGGTMWPVTLTFTLLMTAVACGNVLLVRAVVARRARTRSAA
jgi:hypothetical protein